MHDEDGKWNCKECLDRCLRPTKEKAHCFGCTLGCVRNARGCKKPGNVRLVIYDKEFLQCPISCLDSDASEVVQMIQLSEGGGFGSSRVSPSQLLEETEYYWNVRLVILSEQRRIEKIRKAREKTRDG